MLEFVVGFFVFFFIFVIWEYIGFRRFRLVLIFIESSELRFRRLKYIRKLVLGIAGLVGFFRVSWEGCWSEDYRIIKEDGLFLFVFRDG